MEAPVPPGTTIRSCVEDSYGRAMERDSSIYYRLHEKSCPEAHLQRSEPFGVYTDLPQLV